MRNESAMARTPFSGLGFDLEEAFLTALAMRLKDHEPSLDFMGSPSTSERIVSGYERMLFLGRETGGS